jgi:hypothetical protein
VPQGWLKKHEFNESDLRASIELLDQVFREIENSGKIFLPFSDLNIIIQNSSAHRINRMILN